MNSMSLMTRQITLVIAATSRLPPDAANQIISVQPAEYDTKQLLIAEIISSRIAIHKRSCT
jgi:hypothetical protein